MSKFSIILIVILFFTSCIGPTYKGFESKNGDFIWKTTPKNGFYIISVIFIILICVGVYLKKHAIWIISVILLIYNVTLNFLPNDRFIINTEMIVRKNEDMTESISWENVKNINLFSGKFVGGRVKKLFGKAEQGIEAAGVIIKDINNKELLIPFDMKMYAAGAAWLRKVSIFLSHLVAEIENPNVPFQRLILLLTKLKECYPPASYEIESIFKEPIKK